ncbi:MAG: phage tail tip lysozyme [Fluviibacter sp.]
MAKSTLRDFVQTFLATQKMIGDQRYQEARIRAYDEQTKKLQKENSREPMSNKDFMDWINGGYNGGNSGSGRGSGSGPKPEEMHQYLLDKGATPNEARMLTGSAISESRLTPGAIHDNNTGYGMFGHRLERRDALFKDAGTKTPDWKQQADFSLKELRASPQGKLVNNAKSDQDLVNAQVAFLRPQGYTPNNPQGSHNYDSRLGTISALKSISEKQKPSTTPSLGVEGGTTPKSAVPVKPAVPKTTTAVPEVPKIEAPLKNGDASLKTDNMVVGSLDQKTDEDELNPPIDSNDDWSSPKDVALADTGRSGSDVDLGVTEEYFQVAGGGAIPEQQQAAPQVQDAPMGVVLDAALRNIQASYGLSKGRSAIPSTGSEDTGNLKSFHDNEQAISGDQFDALTDGVDPDRSHGDRVGLAMQKIYSFYAQKGDMKTAAKAAGGVLGAARQRSMEYGQDALDALQKRDVQGAAQALVAAYNQVPDGREVTGKVNDQGIGKAVVSDVASGKVVQELPMNPQLLSLAARKFAAGGDFYSGLAHLATPRRPTTGQHLMAVGGSAVVRLPSDPAYDETDDDEDDPDEEDDGNSAALINTAYTGGSDDEDGGGDDFEDDEAGNGGGGAIPSDGSTPNPSYARPQPSRADVQPIAHKEAPPIIPYHPNMSAEQRRMVDTVNRRRETDWRQNLQDERAAQRNRDMIERQEMGRNFRADQANKALAARQEAAAKAQEARDKRAAAAADLAEKRQQAREAAEAKKEQARLQKEARDKHDNLMRTDKDYARNYNLGLINQKQDELDNNRDLTDEVKDTRRRGLDLDRVDVTAKNSPHRESFATDPDERVKPLVAAMDKIVNSGLEEAKSKKVDTALIPNIPEARQTRMVEAADRIAAYNDISPREISAAVYDITQNMQTAPRILRNGQIEMNGQRLTMPPEALRMLFELRGLREQEYKKAQADILVKNNKREADARQRAVDARDEVDAGDAQRDAWYRAATGDKPDEKAQRAVEGAAAASEFSQRMRDADNRRKQLLGSE